MENNDGARILYFVTGMSIGALAALLFAPHSGTKTRELLANQVEDTRKQLYRRGNEFAERATDYVERGKEVLAEQRDQMVAAVAAGKEAYRTEQSRNER